MLAETGQVLWLDIHPRDGHTHPCITLHVTHQGDSLELCRDLNLSWTAGRLKTMCTL